MLPQEIKERLQLAEDERRPREAVWDLSYKNYRNYVDEQAKKKHEANLFVPYTFASVETLAPRLYSSRITFKAEGQDFLDEKQARLIEGLLQYQWRITRMPKKLLYWVKSSLIYGVGIIKVGWRLEQKEVKTKGFLGREKTAMETLYDDPIVENVDVLDFYPDPNVTDFENMEWCFFRSWYSKQDLIKAGFSASIVNSLDDKGSESQEKSARSVTLGMTSGRSGKGIEVLEYWTPDRLMTIANRNIVLQDDDNPYIPGRIPCIVLLDIPDIHSPYGIGEPETIFSLQAELNDLRNLRLDNVKIIVNKIFKASKEAGLVGDMDVYPGKIFWLDDIGGMQEFNLSEAGLSAFREIGEIKADIQSTTGVSDYQKGIGAEGMTETATGIVSIQEAASLRFTVRSMLLADAIGQLGQLFYEMDRKLLDRKKMIKIAGDKGEEFAEFDPLTLVPNVDIIFDETVNMPVQKSVRKAQNLELFGALRGDMRINQTALYKMLLESFELKNVEELLSGEQMNPQLLQAMAQEGQIPPEMMAQMAGGQAPGGQTKQPSAPEDVFRKVQGTPGLFGGIKRRLFGRGQGE